MLWEMVISRVARDTINLFTTSGEVPTDKEYEIAPFPVLFQRQRFRCMWFFRLFVGFCKIVEFVINLLVFYFQTLNEFSLRGPG